MRAVLADCYGGPEVLSIAERSDPKLGPDSVLVRVRAASVNPVDWKILRGLRDSAFPTFMPFVPGWDFAGDVVAMGPAITDLSLGQPVFGYARKDYVGDGTWAELAAVPARGVAPMPSNADFVEASCLPLAGLTAYQAVTEKIELAAGETLLVHAASGGVGTMATQIAVSLGARVIGTASKRNADYVRSLGAEHVTYGEGLEERVLEAADGKVDAVLDLVGGDALRLSARLARDTRRIVSVVDVHSVRELGGQYVFVRPDVGGLRRLAAMLDDGSLRVNVERTAPMSDVRSAVAQVEGGHVRGKVVLLAEFD